MYRLWINYYVILHRQGCECPSGIVIDKEQRRCVELSQCGREPPIIIAKANETCARAYMPAHPMVILLVNILLRSLVKFSKEITKYVRDQKCLLTSACISQIGQMVTTDGPDLVTSCCGNPENILSVGTTYVVGIGGFCSAYGEWTPYSQYPTEHHQALS